MPETFVAKRYHLAHRAYVASNNVKLQERFPERQGEPSHPPKDGSTPFLSLPTELRLQIYGYLTHNDGDHLESFKRSFNLLTSSDLSKNLAYLDRRPAIPSDSSTNLAYLYRSPGRVTKPHAISKQVINLFHVCHMMRVELIDACFSDRTFVLEASLYQRDAGGLFVLPLNCGPTAWVKRLALLTTIEGHGFVKGIADLRPLQQMTSLKVLYFGFHITNQYGNRKPQYGNCNLLERPDNILKALLECVPKDTKVHFALDKTDCEVFASFDFPCVSADTRVAATALISDLINFKQRKGKLSGSLINHSLCEYHACQEGLDCINSQCKVVIRETQRAASREIPNYVFENIKKEQEIRKAHTDLAAGKTSSPADGNRRRCVHGQSRCYACEKGLKQKLKCWSGRVYRYRTEFSTPLEST